MQVESTPFESFAYYNENGRERTSEFFIGSLDYNKQFDNKSILSLSGLYEMTVLSGPTKNLNHNTESAGDTINYQVMEEYNPLDGLRFNVDYSIPLGEKSKIQSGYQYRWLNHVGKFVFF